MTSTEPRARALVRRALYLACLVALLFGPVVSVFDDLGYSGAGPAYLVISIVMAPLTIWLLYGAFSSRRGVLNLVVLAALYGALSFGYFQGLDDPSWKQPDPKADVFAASNGALHLLVMLLCITALLTRPPAREPRSSATPPAG